MLYLGLLEEVDGEGMQNPMTNSGDYVVLLITITIENVTKKSWHESSPLGKSTISKKTMAIFPNKLENQKIGLSTTKVDVGDFLTKVLSNALLINNCEKEGSISILMEFFSDLLKMKEDGKLLEANKLSKAANLSSNVEIVVDKEEATTPNKKHSKAPKTTRNAATVVKKIIFTCSSQVEEVPI